MSDIQRSPLAIPTELALIGVSVVTLIGFQRLFADSSFVGPVLVFSVLGHLLAMGLRRARVPSIVTALLAIVTFIMLGTWTFYQETTSWGLPSRATLDAIGIDITEGVDVFNTVVAPAPAVTGFVVATALGFWLTAFLSDWAAFRLRAPFESVLPAAGLFILVSVLGTSADRYVHSGVFIAAVLVYLLIHRVADQTAGPGWVRGDADRGRYALLSLGAKLVAVAIAISVLAGPLLPGASEPAILAWRDVGGDGGRRTVISPLVDIGSRLVEQSDIEFFTVRADQPSYWRATPLDVFDGRLWSSQGSFKEADGSLPSGIGALVDGSTERLVQEYQVGPSFGEIWVPAAFEARTVTTTDTPFRWDQRSSTLIVEDASAAGASYTVESDMARFGSDVLNATSTTFPDEIINGDGTHPGYLSLPDGFSPRTAQFARDIVTDAEATTPIQQARALQDFFRNGSFEYDLTPERVGDGHSTSAIETFLFDRKTGFCVHFAGSYAAMARAIGLPSRVAYGFTQGERDQSDPTLYRVTGKYLHSWPEVYIPEYGWMMFEPTPGRGMPGAESYTGVAPAQDGAIDPVVTSTTVTTPNLPSDTFDPDPGLDIPEDVGTAGQGADNANNIGRYALVVLAFMGAGLAYLFAVPALRRVLRSRRRTAAETPNERVGLAWTETIESLELVGVRAGAAETHHEYADRVDKAVELTGAPHRQLADDMVEASFSGTSLSTLVAERAEANAAAIETHVQERIGRRAQIKRELDPRDLLRTVSRK